MGKRLYLLHLVLGLGITLRDLLTPTMVRYVLPHLGPRAQNCWYEISVSVLWFVIPPIPSVCFWNLLDLCYYIPRQPLEARTVSVILWYFQLRLRGDRMHQTGADLRWKATLLVTTTWVVATFLYNSLQLHKILGMTDCRCGADV